MQMSVLFVQQLVHDRQLLPQQQSLLGELLSATLVILRYLQLCRSRLRALLVVFRMYRLTSYLYSCSGTLLACLDDGLVSCA